MKYSVLVRAVFFIPAFIFSSHSVYSCSVCFGDPNSKMSHGLFAAVCLLLGIVIFVLGMRELTASLFLYTTDTRVLSIVIYEQYENGGWSAVASLSLVYTFILIALSIAGRRWMRADI